MELPKQGTCTPGKQHGKTYTYIEHINDELQQIRNLTLTLFMFRTSRCVNYINEVQGMYIVYIFSRPQETKTAKNDARQQLW